MEEESKYLPAVCVQSKEAFISKFLLSGYMTQDVSSYFKLGFHQLRCAPRLIIPFLISTALSSATGWVSIFAFTLISLPVLGEVAPILEKNQHLISEILIEERFVDHTDLQIQELVEELSTLIPEMMPFFVLFKNIYFE